MAASLLVGLPSWACSPTLGLPDGWAASPDSPSTRCFGIPPELSPSLSGCVELCAARGSTPACIRSAAENDVASTLIGDGVPAWLGLYQHDTRREPVEGWGRCVDGDAPCFTNWAAGEPNDGAILRGLGMARRSPQDCAVMPHPGKEPHPGNESKWGDRACSGRTPGQTSRTTSNRTS